MEQYGSHKNKYNGEWKRCTIFVLSIQYLSCGDNERTLRSKANKPYIMAHHALSSRPHRLEYQQHNNDIENPSLFSLIF